MVRILDIWFIELQEDNELVSKSRDQLKRLNYLSDSLLKLIKLDADLEVFTESEFRLKELFNEVNNLISPQLKHLELSFKVNNESVVADTDKSAH